MVFPVCPAMSSLSVSIALSSSTVIVDTFSASATGASGDNWKIISNARKDISIITIVVNVAWLILVLICFSPFMIFLCVDDCRDKSGNQ